MCLDFGSIMKNEIFGVARDDRISSDGIAAICLYSMEMRGCVSFYAYLNQALRLEDRNEIEPFVMYIWIMMNALQNCPPYEGRQVFRGIKVDVHQEYPTGTRFTWYNFISCTCNAKVLENESFFGTSGHRTLFVIEITSYRGRVVTEYGKLSEAEEEVILPPNTVFTAMGVLNLGEGLYMIHLKEEVPIDPIIPYELEGTAVVPNQIILFMFPFLFPPHICSTIFITLLIRFIKCVFIFMFMCCVCVMYLTCGEHIIFGLTFVLLNLFYYYLIVYSITLLYILFINLLFKEVHIFDELISSYAHVFVHILYHFI